MPGMSSQPKKSHAHSCMISTVGMIKYANNCVLYSSELVKFVALERKYIHLEGTGTIKVRIIKHALNEDLF